MATLDKVFTDIANSIRGKTGKANKMTPEQMPAEINSISGGGRRLLCNMNLMEGSIRYFTKDAFLDKEGEPENSRIKKTVQADILLLNNFYKIEDFTSPLRGESRINGQSFSYSLETSRLTPGPTTAYLQFTATNPAVNQNMSYIYIADSLIQQAGYGADIIKPAPTAGKLTLMTWLPEAISDGDYEVEVFLVPFPQAPATLDAVCNCFMLDSAMVTAVDRQLIVKNYYIEHDEKYLTDLSNFIYSECLVPHETLVDLYSNTTLNLTDSDFGINYMIAVNLKSMATK